MKISNGLLITALAIFSHSSAQSGAQTGPVNPRLRGLLRDSSPPARDPMINGLDGGFNASVNQSNEPSGNDAGRQLTNCNSYPREFGVTEADCYDTIGELGQETSRADILNHPVVQTALTHVKGVYHEGPLKAATEDNGYSLTQVVTWIDRLMTEPINYSDFNELLAIIDNLLAIFDTDIWFRNAIGDLVDCPFSEFSFDTILLKDVLETLRKLTPVPTALPTAPPSSGPSRTPSSVPSTTPSSGPSGAPTPTPSSVPSTTPSSEPTALSTSTPSSEPTAPPTSTPSSVPSVVPSSVPSGAPTSTPSSVPSVVPSSVPSGAPTSLPSSNPSVVPTALPTELAIKTPDIEAISIDRVARDYGFFGLFLTSLGIVLPMIISRGNVEHRGIRWMTELCPFINNGLMIHYVVNEQKTNGFNESPSYNYVMGLLCYMCMGVYSMAYSPFIQPDYGQERTGRVNKIFQDPKFRSVWNPVVNMMALVMFIPISRKDQETGLDEAPFALGMMGLSAMAIGRFIAIAVQKSPPVVVAEAIPDEAIEAIPVE